MKQLEYILNKEKEVLAFLKSRYPLYHLSNVFFRDIQYGIQILLERKGMPVGYSESETIARAYVDLLEKKKVLKPIDRQSWVLLYEEFRTPVAKPVPAAKAASSKPAVPHTGAKPALPPLKRPAVGAPASGQQSNTPSLPPLNRPVAAAKPTVAASGQEATAQSGAKGKLPPLNRPVAGSAAKPVSEPVAAQPASEDPQAPVAGTPSAPKPVPPAGKKPLPSIRSSRPAGGG